MSYRKWKIRLHYVDVNFPLSYESSLTSFTMLVVERSTVTTLFSCVLCSTLGNLSFPLHHIFTASRCGLICPQFIVQAFGFLGWYRYPDCFAKIVPLLPLISEARRFPPGVTPSKVVWQQSEPKFTRHRQSHDESHLTSEPHFAALLPESVAGVLFLARSAGEILQEPNLVFLVNYHFYSRNNSEKKPKRYSVCTRTTHSLKSTNWSCDTAC